MASSICWAAASVVPNLTSLLTSKSPVTSRALRVPTDVNDEASTELLSVFPDNVPAAAVTVIFADPLNDTPFIFLAVANVVAVAAFPVVAAAIVSVCPVTNVCIWSAVANAAPPFAIAAVFADNVLAADPLNVVPEFNWTVALSTVNAPVFVPIVVLL